jgi:hypothetical protein
VKSIDFYFKKYHLGLILFLIFYLIYTLFTYKIFPTSSDEEYRYKRGKEQLEFFLNSKPLQNYFEPTIEPDSYYFYVTLLNLLNPTFYYEWFHLQNMLFASIVLISSYLILYSYSKNPYFSSLAPLVLFFTPNFSGHFAFNPIDIPFASLFLLNLFLIYYFRDFGFNFWKIIILGFSFWLLLGLRPLGFQIFAVYLIFHLYYFWARKNSEKIIPELKNLVLIGFISIFFLTISWPYLGINFFKNLPNILLTNASYNKWSNDILFNGSYISNGTRPWYYLFTYYFLTIPGFILILAFFSFLKFKNNLKKLLVFVLLFNFCLYLILQPVIYNGMRHFLYLVPITLCLALMSLWDLKEFSLTLKVKYLLLFPIVLSFCFTVLQFIKLFPYQYAFFNEFTGGTENNILRFETEYWGGLYKDASSYIRDNLAKDKPQDLKVYSCNVSYAMDYYSHKKFLMTINREEADLIVCSVPEDLKRKYQGEIIKTINLGDSPFTIIRKNK